MTAGCQVGRSPSMLATYICVSIIARNTDKEKKKWEWKNIACNSVISVQPWTLDTDLSTLKVNVQIKSNILMLMFC